MEAPRTAPLLCTPNRSTSSCSILLSAEAAATNLQGLRQMTELYEERNALRTRIIEKCKNDGPVHQPQEEDAAHLVPKQDDEQEEEQPGSS